MSRAVEAAVAAPAVPGRVVPERAVPQPTGPERVVPDPRAAASALARVFLQEDINFLVTNRIPRRAATRLMGRLSQVESRLFTRLALRIWGLFADDLRLDEAERRDFRSLRECFVRRLRPGARPIDPSPEVIVSPCDAVVGAHGRLDGTTAIQAKGFPYSIDDLLCDPERAELHRGGTFITLRLKSNMYHRFHAPYDARVRRVTYVSGDTWNVNPIALRRVERLFCKNERAVIDLETQLPGVAITLVPVAAILVASIRFTFVETPLSLDHRGVRDFHCDARLAKGDELGHFESGSTIIVFATGDLRFADAVREGSTLRVGEPLLVRRAPEPRLATKGDHEP